ncbi:hypothetical protein AAFF_G00178570 [Aldrovandia affinis]|uniref:Uncharacterized protein n=1 Tax=Aldrovandia affinis TaxID=143900 RepID=A0AAD7R0B4_9TELE|nr:hypothetical protein AAFF_G00178570 [Aldrovandia affinis]
MPVETLFPSDGRMAAPLLPPPCPSASSTRDPIFRWPPEPGAQAERRGAPGGRQGQHDAAVPHQQPAGPEGSKARHGRARAAPTGAPRQPEILNNLINVCDAPPHPLLRPRSPQPSPPPLRQEQAPPATCSAPQRVPGLGPSPPRPQQAAADDQNQRPSGAGACGQARGVRLPKGGSPNTVTVRRVDVRPQAEVRKPQRIAAGRRRRAAGWPSPAASRQLTPAKPSATPPQPCPALPQSCLPRQPLLLRAMLPPPPRPSPACPPPAPRVPAHGPGSARKHPLHRFHRPERPLLGPPLTWSASSTTAGWTRARWRAWGWSARAPAPNIVSVSKLRSASTPSSEAARRPSTATRAGRRAPARARPLRHLGHREERHQVAVRHPAGARQTQRGPRGSPRHRPLRSL